MELSENKKKRRLDYLDASRGLALLLVIIGHIYNGDNFFIIWIYSFHVPLFFIISGILIKYNKYNNISTIAKKRIKSIMVPYFLFCLINILFEMSLNLSILTLKWTVIQTITFFGIGATWFLPALFIGELGFMIINKYINNKYLKSLIITILFILPLIINIRYTILTVLLRSCTAMGFIYIGYGLSDWIIEEDTSWILILILLFISMILSIFNKNVDLYSLHYNNALLYTICGVIGSITIIKLIKKIDNHNLKILLFMGLNSIIIMSTHQNIIIILRKILRVEIDNLFGETILLLIVILIEYPIVNIINKYAPWIIGKLKKNEKLEVIRE